MYLIQYHVIVSVLSGMKVWKIWQKIIFKRKWKILEKN
jgi:hypothetical protein